MNVINLESALQAYWRAKSRREDQAAYHEILLFGGIDGWHQVGPRGGPTWRGRAARWLRILALTIEQRQPSVDTRPEAGILSSH